MAHLSGINLALQKETAPRESRFFKKITTWGAVIVSLYIFFVAGIFLSGFVLSSRQNMVQNETRKIEAAIRALKKREELEFDLKKRISEVQTVIKSRGNYAEMIEKIRGLTPAGVIYRSFEFSKDKISLSGDAENIFVFGDFLEAIKRAEIFSQVFLTSFSRNKTGGYSFSLEAK